MSPGGCWWCFFLLDRANEIVEDDTDGTTKQVSGSGLLCMPRKTRGQSSNVSQMAMQVAQHANGMRHGLIHSHLDEAPAARSGGEREQGRQAHHQHPPIDFVGVAARWSDPTTPKTRGCTVVHLRGSAGVTAGCWCRSPSVVRTACDRRGNSSNRINRAILNGGHRSSWRPSFDSTDIERTRNCSMNLLAVTAIATSGNLDIRVLAPDCCPSCIVQESYHKRRPPEAQQRHSRWSSWRRPQRSRSVHLTKPLSPASGWAR